MIYSFLLQLGEFFGGGESVSRQVGVVGHMYVSI